MLSLNGLFRVYGIYIIMIVALAGLAIVLFGSNSPIQLSGGSNVLSTCAPDDPTCIPGYGSPSIGETGSKAKAKPSSDNIGGTAGTGSSSDSGSISTTATKAKTSISYVIESMSGSGTLLDPYMITSCQDLQNMSANLGANYSLANNIDCAGFTNIDGLGFMPIGNSTNTFTGTFDGRNFTISNLYINRSAQDNVGLFGYISGGIIKNVGLINVNITGRDTVGGLVGSTNYGLVTNSSSTGTVNGRDTVGGLVGYLYSWLKSGVVNSYSAGTVKGTGNSVGGLIGVSAYPSVINSYSSCNVTGTNNVGGLDGFNNGGYRTNCYATGIVTGTGANVGGLLGSNAATVTNCYAAGLIISNNMGGGLVGSGSSTIYNSSWDVCRSGRLNSAGGGTLINTLSSPNANYLYNTTNPPMTPNWNFTTIWNSSCSPESGYPLLLNVGGQACVKNDYSSCRAPSCPDGMSGLGAPTDPCQVRNWTNLQAMNYSTVFIEISSYALMNDLNSTTDGYAFYQSGSGFSPIGNSTNGFIGTFDG
ncbi:MAG: hypothetical protein NTY68_02340, partial [Candidatus Micrarchaeota archaeon]|nr:hypothetical protein [Candidatus Micrarchaeota archaeon]